MNDLKVCRDALHTKVKQLMATIDQHEPNQVWLRCTLRFGIYKGKQKQKVSPTQTMNIQTQTHRQIDTRSITDTIYKVMEIIVSSLSAQLILYMKIQSIFCGFSLFWIPRHSISGK